MSRSGPKTPEIRVARPGYPWPSVLGALIAISYLLLMLDPGLVVFYALPPEWFSVEIMFGVLGGLALLLVLDLSRFQRIRQRQQADLERVRRQMDDLWARNRALQLKAHTYSGHTDKLKYFISDKLLEYIEYDEKYLHFKGIAAEVRHNGVISFDKVQTALQRAADETRNNATGSADTAADYEAAIKAMRYLWDLLDLSTADNLSLHIGNHLCECEEHYCQRMLNMEEPSPLPYEPVYDPRHAAWRALTFVHPDDPPPPEPDREYRLEDDSWHVRLAPVSDLLGNDNHLVLLVDNLLRNAQFFSRKARKIAGVPSIVFRMEEVEGYAGIHVFNRGPHIREEDREKLFQLGFSTRRNRAHHGRGLGLYFVNEIVKGYEGSIEARNEEIPEETYDLLLHLEDGSRVTCPVETLAIDGEPGCRPGPVDFPGGNTEPAESPSEFPPARLEEAQMPEACEWHLQAPLESVEVVTAAGNSQARWDDFARRGKQARLDPAHPERPHWRITYHPARGNHRLRFEALDVRGVTFEIRLPTASQRIESTEVAIDEDIDAEVERLDERFRITER